MVHVIFSVALSACLAMLSDTSDVVDTLQQWREHIVAKGNLGGVELDSEHYRSLVALGPNCLADVFPAYAREDNPHVLYYYALLIRRVGHFDAFRYSKTPLNIAGYEFKYDGEKPFLSTEIGEGAPAPPASLFAERDKLVHWWEERESFLRREGAKAMIHEITGCEASEFSQYDKRKAREFAKSSVYGIYNIPLLIAIIEEDNNPIAFCELLRISNHPEYQRLKLTGDVVENARVVASTHPTKEQKVAFICTWWQRSAGSFVKLQSLHRAISDQVEELCCRDTGADR